MQAFQKANVPEEVGLSSRSILEYLRAVEASGLEHHSIKVLRHGVEAVTMNFAPYDDRTPHLLFSLSKSFTSAAAGFAVQEGRLSWDSKVSEVLKEDMQDSASEALKGVTLHHLLCMGSGLKAESDRIDGSQPAWARRVLACDLDHLPMEHFHYNSHGTYLVSCMVQKVAGMNVRDYLMPRLFEPLGIPAPDFDMSPDGVCCGGWGLHLSSDSIARFGQCLLQKGVWEGRQVLPPEWLSRATAYQIDNSNGSPDPNNEWHQGYGYQFWRCRDHRFRGDGMYGQLCMVDPARDMVVAVTAGLDDMGLEMKLLHDYLFPAADAEPGTQEEQQALKTCLGELSHPWPGKVLDAAAMPQGRLVGERAELQLRGDMGRILARLRRDDQVQEVLFGMEHPYLNVPIHQMSEIPTRLLAMAGTGSDGTITFLARSLDEPGFVRLRLARDAADRDVWILVVDGCGAEKAQYSLKKEGN
ncbi:MAG: serine hydrolase [Clostridia bacterium]|nr:serine hydrolase [Clostridia bacterium]